MSTNFTRLSNNFEELQLFAMRDNLSSYLDMIAQGDKNIVDGLYELTEKEKELRRRKAIKACVQVAGFPFQKTIKDFDFSFQPSINKQEIEDYLTLRFIENNENLLFVGSSGTGKTHLATSIGIEAAEHRYSVYFISCQELITQLVRAEQENRLERKLKWLNRYKLLVIDEIGYINFDKGSANLFFQLISQRYERRSTIFTTNKNISKWSEVFGDAVIANAILDRILHHCHVINIVGPSYRIKDMLSTLED